MHLSPVNGNSSSRLLTASTSIHSHVVLRHHRPSCVFSFHQRFDIQLNHCHSLFSSHLVLNGKELRHTTSDDNHRSPCQPTISNGDLSPADSDSMSRISQADSGLITTASWSSRSRRDSPTSNSYRHSAASSIDSGRSSTALYDSPKVSQSVKMIDQRNNVVLFCLDFGFIKFYGFINNHQSIIIKYK